MSTRDLRSYVKILRQKAKDILKMLPSVDPNTEEYRNLVINFNNTFSNIQQYNSLINELELEDKNK